MEDQVTGRRYTRTGEGRPLFRPCAPHEVMTRLGDKWTLMVLARLSIAPDEPVRFSQIKASLHGVSQRMLTLTLRKLERDGLLVRHVLPEVPPRVDYALTPVGRSLLPALEGFTAWISAHWPAIEASRARFDGAQPKRRARAPQPAVGTAPRNV